MASPLRTEYTPPVAGEKSVARREPLEWWEGPPGGFLKETKIGQVLREKLAARWRRIHATQFPVHCGDSWPPMFVRCFSLV